ncbi:Acyl-CoA synthetase (AMP-forming)/AMP-acid ligase II [Corynebacterium camporealensis]|uniref:Acyl-CoA synthetase (AMP-forming)/AMP-acid ligase II n=1 Tax=Corynebacterium camporealensis TaxID=161896 RepID=A0A0F6QV88_9CORY|nr:long-chain-fatty-acid--CoA ligase [Corynebacterium camporealensis]AKE38235.1 acyl-CoA synthetase (AMP-forming)/AMP-acid ligase II [Corynebacterium camporealensis]AVH87546.1 Acyl-CoA synthetase (AMP-forming)/AMP-acid ligase II [Corynebacterium camporealensis]
MTAPKTKAWLQHYSPWTPETLDYGETTLVDQYHDTVAAHPNRTATYFFGRTTTYSELDAQVRAAAAGLKAFGIRPGDRVAIVLPNCPQHIVAFYAVQLLGATVVEHNPLYTAHELEGLFQDHGARVAISWDKTAPTLEKLRNTTDLETIIAVNMIEAMPRTQQLLLKIPLPPIASKREMLSEPAENTVPWSTLMSTAIGGNGRDLKLPDVHRDDIALLLYTSGTTGAPKGALLSHGNLVSNCTQGKAWVKGLGDTPERFLAALPMFHTYGMVMAGALGVSIGAELILLPAPRMPLVMDVMKKHTPTWVPGVPTLYEKIMEAADEKDVDLNGIRNSFSGAATLPVPTVEEWESRTGGLLVEGYGLTETSPVLCGNPMNTNRRPGYVGLPFPDTEIRIANPENLDEDMPEGEPGEVLARGPQVFQGYLNNEEATKNAFHNDWFRTGDMGVMEDGFLRLVSRIKEIIITGGFNVYPGEVEETILDHPDVTNAAVVGRPRKDGSEDVVACVILRDGAALDPEGMKEFCRERLTRYKVPRTFYHFEELASDQLGKIRRREVQQDLLKLIGEDTN